MVPKLVLVNKRDCPIQLIIEPIAADYTFLTGETFELVMEDQPPGAYLDIEYQERRIMIWEAKESSDGFCTVGWVVVKKGTEELECGYQREVWERYWRERDLPAT